METKYNGELLAMQILKNPTYSLGLSIETCGRVGLGLSLEINSVILVSDELTCASLSVFVSELRVLVLVLDS